MVLLSKARSAPADGNSTQLSNISRMTRPGLGAPATQPSRAQLLVMASVTALTIANVYYVQPLLVEIGRDLHVSDGTVSLVSTAAQVGYALGLLLLAPLGDIVARRRLIVVLTSAAALLSLATAAAPTLPLLLVALLCVGFCSPVPQLVVPLAAAITSPAQRGKVVGTVQIGVVVGILGSRTVAGAISSLLGWRWVFVAAALGLAALLPLLLRHLPHTPSTRTVPYRQLIGSMPRLFARYPLVPQACISGAATGVALIAFWTGAVFMLADRYGWGPMQVGLLTLVALASAAVTPLAGHFADRRGIRVAALTAGATLVASYAAFLGASASIPLLLLGVALLDGGMQANQVVNQLALFRLDPAITSRVNAVYMLWRYAGMGSGSVLGAAAWLHAGWLGVCAVGGVASAIVVLVHLRAPRFDARP